MSKAREIKNAIEKMAADGLEKMAIIKRVVEMGITAEWADISDEHTITMYNRGGYPYGYGKGFSFTYCTSSYADGPSVDYSKVLLKWLKGFFRIENSYGDNGMDSSTNWHDTFWTYEFICDETVVDDCIFMDYKDEDYD